MVLRVIRAILAACVHCTREASFQEAKKGSLVDCGETDAHQGLEEGCTSEGVVAKAGV